MKLSLDLGEIITQLRTLADTLEATQTPKTDPEPDKPTDCERCDTNEWEAWNRSQWHVPGSRAGRGARQPKPAELDECRHEAWDVHPNGITRRCSDCRAPLPDLEPGTCHCGAKPNEVHNPLFAHPERVTVSEVYINPNPNGFTPEAVEALVDAEMRRARHPLPDGDFPCCAPRPHARPLGFEVGRSGDVLVDDVLRCPRCDDPWHPREICPACGCDNYRKNNPK